jgi:hypothetical protein
MSSFCGQIVALGLTIATAIIYSFIVTSAASDLLVDLKVDTAKTQIDLTTLAIRVPGLLQCQVETLNRTEAITNCSNLAVSLLAFNTELLTNKTNTLNMHTVESFNNTVTTIITESCERIALLQVQILQATINQTTAIPQNIQTGNVVVDLVGGDMFNLTYSVKQLVLGDLKMIYLNLPKWPNSLTTITGQVNPVVKFRQFDPPVIPGGTNDVFKPLLITQSDRFVWTITSPQIVADSYRWDSAAQELEIHSIGTSMPTNLVALLEDLNVVMQFL